MTHIHQSAAWWCFVPDKMTPEAFVRACADSGYEAIDLVDQDYWPLVRDHGLKIGAVKGHLSIPNGLNRREHWSGIEQELRASIESAAENHIPNLIVFSGNRYGLDDKAGAEVAAENLCHIAQTAQDAGVTLIIELLNSKIDHPGYQCDHTAWGVQVCEMVGSPSVKLLYDIYHMQIMEGDIIHTIQQYHPYFGHYHTAGNPGRNEIDESQELNYPPIMRAILVTGYEGYVAQEFIPLGDPAASLKAAFDLCNLSV